MTIDVNLEEVKDFVESGEFSAYLVNHTTNIGVAAFIFSAVLEKLEKATEEIKSEVK